MWPSGGLSYSAAQGAEQLAELRKLFFGLFDPGQHLLEILGPRVSATRQVRGHLVDLSLQAKPLTVQGERFGVALGEDGLNPFA